MTMAYCTASYWVSFFLYCLTISSNVKITVFENVNMTVNANMTLHSVYENVTGILEWDKFYSTGLRLPSHGLAIELERWSRIPKDQRLCLCGVLQIEKHVICFCPLNDYV